MSSSGKSTLSIPQLMRVLKEKQSLMTRLHKKRAKLQRRIDSLDKQVQRVEGERGDRRRNDMSLVQVIDSILDAVIAHGYQSSSTNFKGIVNQTLIKERDKFEPVKRGVYKKKAA